MEVAIVVAFQKLRQPRYYQTHVWARTQCNPQQAPHKVVELFRVQGLVSGRRQLPKVRHIRGVNRGVNSPKNLLARLSI